MADFHTLYRLDPKPIAIGGQAVVTRATHRKTGRIVALKQRKDGNPEAADRMRREIDVQTSIQHVNVMPILDADTDDYAWFTMPLAASALADSILPLATTRLVSVLTETIAGLQVAHQLGFVHRDIKPSNILHLQDEHGDRWVVADWGIVRRPHGATTSDHTHTGVMLGTDGFAPPEAYADSHSASFSWDSYSLGTSTGKTTLLNALAAFLPANDRVVLIEDTAELQVDRPNLVRFEARREQPNQPAVSIRELLRATLRHRPDRIIVGEVRGGEAFDLLQALNTGHSGSLSTIHANSAEQALARFASCVVQSAVELPYQAVRYQIADAIDLVLHLARRRGARVVEELIRIERYEAARDGYERTVIFGNSDYIAATTAIAK